MGEQISIELTIDSLTYDTQIVGNIAFVINSYDYFPGQSWSDFVAIVLNWWIDSCRALVFAPYMNRIHSPLWTDQSKWLRGK